MTPPIQAGVASRRLAVLLLPLLLQAACATARTSDAAAPAPPSQQWLALDSLLRTSFPADGPGASAIVVHDGALVYRGAAGMANLEQQVAMEPGTVLPIFSVTKQFTAVAVLMLAEEGKLSLFDPIGRFLPDLPARLQQLTVAQLMGHTSGLANYSDHPAMMEMLEQHVTKSELITLFVNEPFLFPPGSQWAYNNSGYVLLGAIIERLSGMSHGNFIRSRILQPLGMNDTHVYDSPDVSVQRRARGYTRAEGEWRPAPPFSLTLGWAVGNMLSTVDDLARWEAAIQRGALLTPDSWRRAFTSFRQDDGTPVRYGAGWYLGRLDRHETAEHQGNFMGGLSSVVRVPGERLFVAVLANAEPAPVNVERLSLEMAALVLGTSVEPEGISVPVSQLDQYVGSYRIDDVSVRVITREGRQLFSQRSGGNRFELVPVGEDLFHFPAADALLRFERAGGRIAAVTMLPRLGPAGEPARRVD